MCALTMAHAVACLTAVLMSLIAGVVGYMDVVQSLDLAGELAAASVTPRCG